MKKQVYDSQSGNGNRPQRLGVLSWNAVLMALGLGLLMVPAAQPEDHSEDFIIPPSNSQNRPALQRGISSAFPKRREIVSGDSFGAQPLPERLAFQKLSRYDAIWCARLIADNNLQAWRWLRARRPEIVTLFNLSGVTTRKEYAGGMLDYHIINQQNPQWFLLGDVRPSAGSSPRVDSDRIRWSSDPKSSHYDRFYLDIGNPKFQQWAAEQILARVSGRRQHLDFPYHGMGMDNVSIGNRRMHSITNRYPHWKYAGDMAGWTRDYLAYMRVVRERLQAHDFKLYANHNLSYGETYDDVYWDDFINVVDGIITERALGDGRTLYVDEEWERAMRRHELIVERQRVDWWMIYPPDAPVSGQTVFDYTYCSWLLTKTPGYSLYFATRGDRSYSNPRPPWYREYELPLGRPIGKRYQQDGCWLRRFDGGLVIVNPTLKQRSAELPSASIWTVKGGSPVSGKLMLPPSSGTILLMAQPSNVPIP
jgi:hypothetical protein